MSNPTPVAEVGGDASATFDQEEWNAFKITHKKQYADEEEEEMRIKIFLESKNKIAKHNADYEKGLTTFKMGINHLADRRANPSDDTGITYYKTDPHRRLYKV